MLRIFSIIATVWKFRLDDIVLAASRRHTALAWRRLTCRHPAQPGAVRLRLALEHLGPIFVKFGQVLSTRRDILPAPYAEELRKLQDRVPPETESTIRTQLKNTYRQPMDEIFSHFDWQPCGSASVAQVHRATLAENGDIVAVKILRPNIKARIQQDLRLLKTFAFLAEVCLKNGKKLKPRALIQQFANHLEEETQLLREAANCAKISRNFADSDKLRTPAVYWRWCTNSIMVMQFLPGVSISRIGEFGKSINRRTLAKIGVELFFTQVFRDNFFHADMHPGNLHVNADGQFVLLDYGIVGQLSDFDREYLLRNFLAFLQLDYRGVAEMHIAAGWVPIDTDINAFESEIRATCEPIFAQPLRNISFGEFLLQMFQAARKFNLDIQPQLILLQKTLLNVEGMGRDLDPDFDMWATTKPILQHWMNTQYHPKRALALLKRQAPDWFALLNDMPVVARQLLIKMKHIDDTQTKTHKLRRRLRRWQSVTIVAIAVAVWLALQKYGA